MAQFGASAFLTIRKAVAARSFSASDLPMPTPCACRKVLAMPPPITSASTLLTRFSRRSILVETLASPMMATTGVGRQFTAEALGRGMRAMRGRKCVVDPDVAVLCQGGDEGWIVLLFLLVEAGILQAQDVAILHRRDCLLGDLADAVVGKADWFFQDAREFSA